VGADAAAYHATGSHAHLYGMEDDVDGRGRRGASGKSGHIFSPFYVDHQTQAA